MEMSRQRLRPSLGDSTQLTCPRCKGQGTIRNVESVTLAVLRLIEEEAMKKGTERVIAHLPIDCATFLLNEKRAAIQELEARLRVGIVVLPSRHLETPAYDIERIKTLEGVEDKASHLHIKEDEISVPEFAKQTSQKFERAAVKEFLPDAPAPVQNKKTSTSLIQRFWQRLIGRSTLVENTLIAEASSKSEEKPKNNRNKDRNKDRNGAGRNSRRNNKRNPNNNQVTETLTIVEDVKQVTDSENSQDNLAKKSANSPERPQQERTARRGRNRRRSSRNGGERKSEPGIGSSGENSEKVTETQYAIESIERRPEPIHSPEVSTQRFEANKTNESDNSPREKATASNFENDTIQRPQQTRPYDLDFAERSQRAESSNIDHRHDNEVGSKTSASSTEE
jgi:ribonuclease E